MKTTTSLSALALITIISLPASALELQGDFSGFEGPDLGAGLFDASAPLVLTAAQMDDVNAGLTIGRISNATPGSSPMRLYRGVTGLKMQIRATAARNSVSAMLRRGLRNIVTGASAITYNAIRYSPTTVVMRESMRLGASWSARYIK